MMRLERDIETCRRCAIPLRLYYTKMDGTRLVMYKRCPDCTEVFEVRLDLSPYGDFF